MLRTGKTAMFSYSIYFDPVSPASIKTMPGGKHFVTNPPASLLDQWRHTVRALVDSARAGTVSGYSQASQRRRKICGTFPN